MGRPITVAAGPLAAGSATKAALSQKSAAAGYLVLNGAAGSFTANNICLSQTPGGAGALLLNGAAVTGGVGYIPGLTATRIYITCAADESGKTFTVVGTINPPSGIPLAVTEVITGANASTVSSAKLYNTIVSITVSAGTAGALTVGNYGVATLDTARRVILTSGGDDSAISFVVSGTNNAGDPISETVTGANAGVASTVLDYLSITSIRSSAAVATTVTVGTNGIAGSPWVRFSDWNSGSQTTIAAVVTGTANYSIQLSMDDPNLVSNTVAPNTYQTTPAGMTWIDSLDTTVVAATATKASYFNYTPIFARVLLNSSTGTGNVVATFRQADNG